MKLSNFCALALCAIIPAHATRDKSHSNSRTTFYKGHDISSLLSEEEHGITYKDTARGNVTRPLEHILGDGGMNSARLRLWVNPPAGDYGLNYTLRLASRLYQQGYEIYLDLHLSDNWADPEHQITPKGWPDRLGPLSDTLRKYVKDTLVSFKDAGVSVAIVSLGNEVTHGLLWPLGRADPDILDTQARVSNFTNFATLLTSARRGVDDAVSAGVATPEIMLHTSFGWNSTLQSSFYDTLVDTGKFKTEDWDSFGISFYPWNGDNATWNNLRKTLATLSRRYQKAVHVAETDYPVLCTKLNNTSDHLKLGLSPQGQTQWVRTVQSIVRSVPNGYGRGVWYWEPGWVNGEGLGSQCDDLILFDGGGVNASGPVAYSRSSVDMYLDL